MRTKKQELQILDKTIAELGPDSYIGPWLQKMRDNVKDLIMNDLLPSEFLSVEESRKIYQDTYERYINK